MRPMTPHEHELHHARVAHGAREALRPSTARGCAEAYIDANVPPPGFEPSLANH